MRLVINNQDITFTTLEWSGSKYNAARRLDISYPSNLTYKLAQGNIVQLFSETIEIFTGYLFRRDSSHQGSESSLLAYDPMIYLLKSSGSYNFKSTTLGIVFSKVAADLGIPVGQIVDSSTKIVLEPQLNQNCYQVLLEACRKANKVTGKVYLPKIINSKLTLVHAGEVS